MGFNLTYWTYICGKYFLNGSFLEKCGKIWKNGRFSGRLQPDWGNTARADTAELGSKGLTSLLLLSTLASIVRSIDAIASIVAAKSASFQS